ncbi:hypothetical protein D3C85_1943760 [compost metagenome]
MTMSAFCARLRTSAWPSGREISMVRDFLPRFIATNEEVSWLGVPSRPGMG